MRDEGAEKPHVDAANGCASLPDVCGVGRVLHSAIPMPLTVISITFCVPVRIPWISRQSMILMRRNPVASPPVPLFVHRDDEDTPERLLRKRELA
jgi:hypothetical protein